MNELDWARIATASCARITSAGVKFEQTAEFEKISTALFRTERRRVSPEMSHMTSDLFHADYISLAAWNIDGELAAHVGVRRYRLGREAFSEHLHRQYRRLYADGAAPFNIDLVPPVMREITGDVAYIGDLIIEQQWRKRINLDDLVRAAFAIGSLKFDPDWTVGFISQRNMMRGLAASFIAPRCCPYSIPWEAQPKTRKRSDWFLCVKYEDLTYTLNKIADDFSAEDCSYAVLA